VVIQKSSGARESHPRALPKLDVTVSRHPAIYYCLKAATLAGECQKVFVAAVFAFHTGKPVVDVAAIQIPINHLLDVRSPESVLS